MGLTLPWTRFLLPRGEPVRLDSDGYAIDPRRTYGNILQPAMVCVADVPDSPCTVILGEAGIGKSAVLGEVASALRSRLGTNSVIELDLGTFGTAVELDTDLFGTARFSAWKDGAGELHLVLDSLDEAMAGMQSVVGLFQRRFTDLPFDRLRLWIACRPDVWPETLVPHLASQAGGTEAVRIYTLAPLLRCDVEAAAKSEGLDPNEFVAAVAAQDAESLASNPLSLQFLINIFKTTGQFPRNRSALFDQGLLALCENREERVDRRTASRYSGHELLAVATRLGALSILTGHPEIEHVVQDGVPPSGLSASSCVGGVERTVGSEIEASLTAVRSTLNTALFASRGTRRVGFVHRSYAEFLAARYLAGSTLSLDQIIAIMCVAEDPRHRLAPQLHETAAWLAAMRPDFFDHLLDSEPEVLLHSDTRALDALTKGALVANLIERVDADELSSDQRYEFLPRLSRLRYDGLARQLQLVIASGARRTATREFAMQIGARCSVGELAQTIADVALDAGADLDLRVSAGYAVCELKEPGAGSRLKPLAFVEQATDPEDRLRGLALRACWPACLTAAELFRTLVVPARPNFGGSYSDFLHRFKPSEHLSPEDLPVALDWASQVNLADPYPGHFGRIARAIVTMAWQHTGEPDVITRMVPIVWHAYESHECPFHVESDAGDDRAQNSAVLATNAMLASDSDARQRLLDAIVMAVPETQSMACLATSACPLARADDFEWLLDRAVVAAAPRSVQWARLAMRVFDWDEARTDFLLRRCGESQELAQAAGFPLKIDLESSTALEGKEARTRRKGRQQAGPDATATRESASQIAGRALSRCLMGEEGLLPSLFSAMTGNEGSRLPEIPPADIRTTTGWQEASEGVRSSIIEACCRFLSRPPEPADNVLAKDNSFTLADLAAPQALLLVMREAPPHLQKITPELWERWTPHVLVMLSALMDLEEDDRRSICELCRSKAPMAARATVQGLIEKGATGSGVQTALYLLEHSVDDELAGWVLSQVAERAYGPGPSRDLISSLLRLRRPEAFAFVHEELRTAGLQPLAGEPLARSVEIAIAGLRERPGDFWTPTWDAMRSSEPWGRALIERLLVDGYGGGGGLAFVQSLTDTVCGDLVAWLLTQYPPPTDPGPHGVYTPAGRDFVARFRSGLLERLRGAGTLEARDAIARVCRDHPEHSWLHDYWLDACRATRRALWAPLSPEELLRLVSDQRARVVRDGSHLLDLVVESLNRLHDKLHGVPPARPDLWNATRPKSEDDLSNYVRRHLQADLVDRGIVVNREVVIRPGDNSAGAPGQPGQRVDIQIDAIRQEPRTGERDVCSVVAEVKGCWNRGVTTSMREQLAERYLRENPSRYGLYVVGWFSCGNWDPTDYRGADVPWTSLSAARTELETQANELSSSIEDGQIRSYVLDCALR